jgi:hypothetical protein
MHNETLSVAAMRVSNPDRSPVGINRGDAAPTRTGFAEIVSDYYANYSRRSHDAVIRVYDEAGNVIETHEYKGDFKEAS